MKKFRLFNIQLFAEGEGASDGEGAVAEASAGEEIPSSIPARARGFYKKALDANKPRVEADTPVSEKATEDTSPTHIPFSDLIKSDEYKDEHKAYMDKTIGDRLKKYKGLEENFAKANDVLSIVAQKYGLDVNSETFLEDIKAKAEADDSYLESYAMEHDISNEEARRVLSLERKVAEANAQRLATEEAERQRRVEAENMERWERLKANAEKTKAQFPEFDLESALQDEKFKRLCIVTQEDTTAAYMACNWGRVIPNAMQMASRQASIQTANAIASGQNRPSESGLSSNASAVVEKDFSKMNLSELRAYADEQRRKSNR